MRIVGVNKEETQMSERMTVGQADTMSAGAWTSPALANTQPWELEDQERKDLRGSLPGTKGPWKRSWRRWYPPTWPPT